MKNTKSIIHNSLFIILFLLAFLERTVFDFGPNIELLTSALVLSSFYFGVKKSFLGILTVMVLSDLIIGNTNIFIFTWSGFLIPAIFLSSTVRNLYTKYNILNTEKIFSVLTLTFSGLSANLFFYFYTNFGVWLLDSWGMYTKDFQGLMFCYINALPFLKNQIVSSLIFIPIGVLMFEYIFKLKTFRFFSILKSFNQYR